MVQVARDRRCRTALLVQTRIRVGSRLVSVAQQLAAARSRDPARRIILLLEAAPAGPT
jgi:hypothetical protein